MSKHRQTDPVAQREEKPTYVLITTLIAAFATIIAAAIVIVSGSINQAALAPEATGTVEALHTLMAMTAQEDLAGQTAIPAPTASPAPAFTSTRTSIPGATIHIVLFILVLGLKGRWIFLGGLAAILVNALREPHMR